MSRSRSRASPTPWTDLALTGDSMTARSAHDALLTHTALEQASLAYLGRADPTEPRASPLYGDLACLSPVMLHVGEDEILLSDAQRMADRIVAAGSAAELHVWQGMVHVVAARFCAPRQRRSISSPISCRIICADKRLGICHQPVSDGEIP